MEGALFCHFCGKELVKVDRVNSTETPPPKQEKTDYLTGSDSPPVELTESENDGRSPPTGRKLETEQSGLTSQDRIPNQTATPSNRTEVPSPKEKTLPETKKPPGDERWLNSEPVTEWRVTTFGSPVSPRKTAKSVDSAKPTDKNLTQPISSVGKAKKPHTSALVSGFLGVSFLFFAGYAIYKKNTETDARSEWPKKEITLLVEGKSVSGIHQGFRPFGTPNGSGRFMAENLIFEGTFREGEFYEGKLTVNEKDVYQGSFKKGNLHGFGTRYHQDGSLSEGEFNEGSLEDGFLFMFNSKDKSWFCLPLFSNEVEPIERVKSVADCRRGFEIE